MNKLDQLKARLENCKTLKAEELALNNPNPGFLTDVNETIKYCEKEMARLKKNPSVGFEMVNE